MSLVIIHPFLLVAGRYQPQVGMYEQNNRLGTSLEFCVVAQEVEVLHTFNGCNILFRLHS